MRNPEQPDGFPVPRHHYSKREAKSICRLLYKKVGFTTRIFIVIAALLICQGLAVFGVEWQNDGLSCGMPDDYNQVYIPKSELPRPPADSNADMAGVIVYNGKVYHQVTSGAFTGQNTDAEALKGDFLGKTVNLKQYADEFRKETLPPIEKFYKDNKLVANWNYDVYTVKGYDSDFRLMVSSYGGAMFFERDNDIWIAKGSDLFGKMKMLGNIRAAERDAVPYNGGYAAFNMPLSGLEDFAAALYESPFVTMSLEARKELMERPNAYLYLVLGDGTAVTLRLYEGGMVSYEALGISGFFRMEATKFEPVFKRLAGYK